MSEDTRANQGGFQSYEEALQYLENTVNYEKKRRWKFGGGNLKLDRMRRLLEAAGDPQKAFKVIHIAGTKGKGSTAAVIANCLREAGWRVGLYTSPHLIDIRERIRVDGGLMSQREFTQILGALAPYISGRRAVPGSKPPSYFEILTTVAFEFFRRRAVDWAVVEVGLGGRFDATNMVEPVCCVITNIGIDHTVQLGSDVRDIAADKAGIIKPRVPTVIGLQKHASALKVLRRRAHGRRCPMWEVGREIQITESVAIAAETGNRPGWRFSVETARRVHRRLFTPLLGRHQVQNCASAIGALDLLADHGIVNVSDESIRAGIAECTSPGRVELLQRRPAVVLDTAHTVESIEALMKALEAHFPAKPLKVIFGCSRDKNINAMIGLLSARCRELVATQADSPRARSAEQVAAAASAAGIPSVRQLGSPPVAMQTVLAESDPDDLVCVTGSFYVAGEICSLWTPGTVPATS